MNKFLSLLFIVFISACANFGSSEGIYLINSEDERLYVEVDGQENSKNNKLVFIQHGLASNLQHQVVQTAKKAFIKNGYVVVTFDARHSLGKDDNNVEKVSLASFEEDLRTVTQWAEKQDFYHEPFALVGHSLGGASVLQFAADNPQKVNILVPVAPVISGKLWEQSCMKNMTDFCKEWKSNGSYEYTDMQNGKTAVIPYSVVSSSMSYNAELLAPKIKAATLLVAANNDIVIEAKHVKNLADHTGSSTSFAEIAASGHNFETKQNQSDLYYVINSFLHSCLFK
ncbi:MAG: alpha/beta hydrolase [Alphaproteobacteria bacterium]|nr:alpha/beta hydrolase [Alphaproteobacteria bacterium]